MVVRRSYCKVLCALIKREPLSLRPPSFLTIPLSVNAQSTITLYNRQKQPENDRTISRRSHNSWNTGGPALHSAFIVPIGCSVGEPFPPPALEAAGSSRSRPLFMNLLARPFKNGLAKRPRSRRLLALAPPPCDARPAARPPRPPRRYLGRARRLCGPAVEVVLVPPAPHAPRPPRPSLGPPPAQIPALTPMPPSLLRMDAPAPCTTPWSTPPPCAHTGSHRGEART